MDSKMTRSKPLEAFLCIFLLILLLLIIATILLKQSDFDLTRYGYELNSSEKTTPRQNAEKKAFLDFSTLTGGDLVSLSDTEQYSVDNLYEKINGKAPLYTEAGFEKLYTHRYVHASDSSLWAELYVYDMGKAENAFSVFSAQRRPLVKPLAGVASYLGYKTTNSISFCHGKYYIELVGSAESEKLLASTENLAANIRGKIEAGADSQIAAIKILSGTEFTEGSIGFYLADAFAFSKFNNLYTAKYFSDDEQVTVFLSKRSDPDEAQKLAGKYRDFMVENGSVEKEYPDSGENWYVLDFYGDIEIVFSYADYIGGVHAGSDTESANAAAKYLKDRISEVLKK